jgi:hypothetical protein
MANPVDGSVAESQRRRPAANHSGYGTLNNVHSRLLPAASAKARIVRYSPGDRAQPRGRSRRFANGRGPFIEDAPDPEGSEQVSPFVLTNANGRHQVADSMADSRPVRSSVTGDLLRLLSSYVDGQRTIEDFLAWEAERSLEVGTAGAFSASLDHLSIVAAEVCDGVRGEGEFRTLAREVLTAGLAGERAAVAETPASYGASGDPGEQEARSTHV